MKKVRGKEVAIYYPPFSILKLLSFLNVRGPSELSMALYYISLFLCILLGMYLYYSVNILKQSPPIATSFRVVEFWLNLVLIAFISLLF